jgi:hypothetical protein
MRLRGRAARIHHHNPLRLSRGNRYVTFVHAGEECAILLLEAVLVAVMLAYIFIGAIRSAQVAPPCASHAHPRIGVEQDRQIRLQISAKDTVEFQNSFAA